MRGRIDRERHRWLGRKRASLQRILLAGIPMFGLCMTAADVFAQGPSTNGFTLPPLPLQGEARGLQANPFCQPAASTTPNQSSAIALGIPRAVAQSAASQSQVQLASGPGDLVTDSAAYPTQNGSIVKLLPIESTASGPMAGSIRPNPLIVSEPQALPIESSPVDEHGFPEALPSDQVVCEDKAEFEQQACLGEELLASEMAGQVAETGVQDATTVKTIRAIPKPIKVEPVNAESVTVAPAVKPPKVAQVSGEQADGGPVSFSLNDMKLVETTTDEGAPAAAAETSAPKKPTWPKQVDAPKSSVESNSIAGLVKGKETKAHPASQKRQASDGTTIVRGASTRTHLVPLEPADAIKPAKDLTQPKVPSVADERIVRGGRPRVDVGVPAVAIERSNGKSQGLVAAVSELPVTTKSAVAAPDLSCFESTSPVHVELKRTEVRSLKTDSEIRKVQVCDSSVCAAIGAGPNQIQLIGVSDGTTRIAIWVASPKASGPDGERQVYEIQVGNGGKIDSQDAGQVASTLTRSTQAAFPGSSIVVRHDQGKMIVEGTCSDNEVAKQALRMIRTACLLPVIDKLTIR